ncbi:MAG TPA: NUDIX hydrolase [Acidimicrobiia bacterium]|jgi:8-oxo-dGTP pyrophosphatase MutT (NUDIX family)|nr:NUDIX hydrolase [Acidimicrobiia bacterium]
MTTERAPHLARSYRQSAALPYRYRDGDLEVLLVTSRKRGRWIAPKGIVERGLTPAASAAKEALEEAGVEGDVSEHALGSYRHSKWHGVRNVELFPLLVTTELDQWDESAFRERRWMPVTKAMSKVDNLKLARLIGRLPEFVGVAQPR